MRAIILLRTKDPAGALREAQRAFEIDPGNNDAVGILAAKKVADGDPDGALKLLNSLKLDAQNETRISQQKIQIYAAKKDFTQAEALLRRVIALNPGEAGFQTQLGRAPAQSMGGGSVAL